MCANRTGRAGSDGLAAAVASLPAGWRGHYLDLTASTQDDARSAADEGAPDRSVFVADYQSAGRGRHGRTWQARPGSALMLSIVFRDTPAAALAWRWTNLAAVSLVEAMVETVPGVSPAIKWPNDVVLDGRKVAGILAESATDGTRLRVIVGIGVNVGADERDLATVGAPATSLRLATGRTCDRGALLHALVARMQFWLAQPPATLHAAWAAALWGRGQRLRLLDLGSEQEVVVLGADGDGALRVRLADGTERRTTTGELLA